MARLTEHRGKALLREFGIRTPRGEVARSPAGVKRIATALDTEVVLKAQAFVTGRLGRGLVKFAATPAEAVQKAKHLFSKQVGHYRIEEVLIEERIDIETEYFASVYISDEKSVPLMMFSSRGGTGIETMAGDNPADVAVLEIDVIDGPDRDELQRILQQVGIIADDREALTIFLQDLWKTARHTEARTLEINPIVKTSAGQFLAADCRISIDDYAVFRHPELGIKIARELGWSPGPLDQIAYRIEEKDYRGTFYFMQLPRSLSGGTWRVGYHGIGGGGSMMGMDALQRRGIEPANFCDTSGNPAASKVYRAAMLILSQEGIAGYFGTGSGVASQEQFHLARGLVKAFREKWLSVPAVMRLGGNGEDEAVRILQEYTADLPATVEGYKKDDTVEFCVERFEHLLSEAPAVESAKPRALPPSGNQYSFQTLTGEIIFDHDLCLSCASPVCIAACSVDILELEKGKPQLNISAEDAQKGKCVECLACELECHFHGNRGCRIELPIEGL